MPWRSQVAVGPQTHVYTHTQRMRERDRERERERKRERERENERGRERERERQTGRICLIVWPTLTDGRTLPKEQRDWENGPSVTLAVCVCALMHV